MSVSIGWYECGLVAEIISRSLVAISAWVRYSFVPVLPLVQLHKPGTSMRPATAASLLG